MRVDDLRQIDDRYDHVYLSPHLDDAALSCGGAIANAAMAGARVLVVTICTGIPPAEGPFSDLARELHAQWSLSPEEAVTARLKEDALAMERLGADWYWVGMLDAIYRVPEAYHSRDTLFGTPRAGDPLLPAVRQLLDTLQERAPRAMFYVPLGVGSHVDHLITYVAGASGLGAPLSFFEDVPYVVGEGELDRRLRQIGERLSPSIMPIAATLERKLESIAAYASQMGALFGGEAAMRRTVAAYAMALREGGGERLWSWTA